jgi:dUTP pyrophosphatase
MKSAAVFSSETFISPEPFLRWYVADEVKGIIDGEWFRCPKDGDAGFDLRSSEDLLLSPHTTVLVSTGVHVAVPPGYVGIVKDRSSMAMQSIISSGGVIDEGYRGEVKVVLTNNGVLPFHIVKGDRIAQLLVVSCMTRGGAVEFLDDLGATVRGAGGFGSTGRR